MTGVHGSCEMPTCASAATTTNRAKQPTCEGHRLVVVTGSFVNDRHTDGGHA